MRNLILLCTVFVFSACTTESLSLKPAHKSKHASTLENNEKNLMLKKAVVKLIRKYKLLNEKTAAQAAQIKALDNRITRHDKEIKSINSGMSTIKKFVSEDIEEKYSVEVGMPVVNLREAPSIDAAIRGKVNMGNKLEVIDKSQGDWYQVEYNNKPAWIHSSTLKKER